MASTRPTSQPRRRTWRDQHIASAPRQPGRAGRETLRDAIFREPSPSGPQFGPQTPAYSCQRRLIRRQRCAVIAAHAKCSHDKSHTGSVGVRVRVPSAPPVFPACSRSGRPRQRAWLQARLRVFRAKRVEGHEARRIRAGVSGSMREAEKLYTRLLGVLARLTFGSARTRHARYLLDRVAAHSTTSIRTPRET